MRRRFSVIPSVALAALLASCQDGSDPVASRPDLRVEPPGGGFSGRIAFDRIGVGMVVMNGDGSGQTVITSTVECRNPAWSPDGQRIACTSRRDGNNEIYVVNADGSGAINLTNHPASDARAAWSGDGTRIAFVSTQSGRVDIWVMNADGSGPVNITNSTAFESAPVWSPDGARIAFEGSHEGNQEIFVMNADGSGQSNLTNDPERDTAPAWSPDGARIAFLRAGSIFVMNVDGTGVTQVTRDIPVGSESGHLAWSPDGRRIAFEGQENFAQRIFVTKVDQPGEIEQLTTNAEPGFGDIYPAWTWRRN